MKVYSLWPNFQDILALADFRMRPEEMYWGRHLVVSGGLIGYPTNYVAVWMLFNPLREVRIAGKVLPPSPGLFPRYKGRLPTEAARIPRRRFLSPARIERHIGSHRRRALEPVMFRSILFSGPCAIIRQFLLGTQQTSGAKVSFPNVKMSIPGTEHRNKKRTRT